MTLFWFFYDTPVQYFSVTVSASKCINYFKKWSKNTVCVTSLSTLSYSGRGLSSIAESIMWRMPEVQYLLPWVALGICVWASLCNYYRLFLVLEGLGMPSITVSLWAIIKFYIYLYLYIFLLLYEIQNCSKFSWRLCSNPL